MDTGTRPRPMMLILIDRDADTFAPNDHVIVRDCAHGQPVRAWPRRTATLRRRRPGVHMLNLPPVHRVVARRVLPYDGAAPQGLLEDESCSGEE
jgi:hypothetical protein